MQKNRSSRVLLIFLIVVCFAINTAIFAGDLGYYRFPDVRGDLVVFASEGDIWSVSLKNGGDAKRLTSHEGRENHIRISPDGRWIAFSGQYDGNKDVYIIPATGGAPKRLTFLDSWDEVVGWTHDSQHVLFRSHRFTPNFTWNVYAVAIDGGYPKSFGLDKCSRISLAPDSDEFAYTRIRRERTSWKRYKGGQAMDIWYGNFHRNEFKKLTRWEGTDAFPMWIRDRIYYLSDQAGRKNIFSMKADGTDIKQHTFEENWDLDNPSTDGKTIVFQREMDIWYLDLTSGKSGKIDITLPTDRIRTRERIVNPKKFIEDYSIPDNGKRLAVSARGDIFTFQVKEKGYIRQLTESSASRERDPSFSPDGKYIALISDVTGEDEIWLYQSDGKAEPKQLTTNGDRRKNWIKWSPDGEKLLYADKSDRIWIVDIEDEDQEMVADLTDLSDIDWSPDSEWLAYINTGTDHKSDIYLYNLDKKRTTRLDYELTDEHELSFDPDGKYLYFKSTRWFNPKVENGSYIFDKGDKFYALLLNKDVENPFASELIEAYDDETDKDEDEDEEDDKDEKDKDEKEFKIDIDGIENRIVRLPVRAGNYFGLYAVSGKIYYGSWEDAGMRSQDERDDGWQLHMFDMDEDESEEVGGGRINGYRVSPNREKMVVKQKGRYIVMKAGAGKIPDEDGVVDLGGWNLTIDPQTEWRQILREVWRLQRDYFYAPNLHGVNWDGVWDQYSVKLPRIFTRNELNDLIREMLGELNVGHAYISGGDIEHPGYYDTGTLGIDFEQHPSGAYLVNRILSGDKWGDEPVSPCDVTLGDIKPEEYIVAVNGHELTVDDNIFEYLIDKSDEEVLLSVNDKPRMRGAREVLVKTMGNESRLRYLDWVRDRREYVENISNGRVGYIHIPDMGGWGLSMWGRQYYSQLSKDALVFDVRYNRGGWISNMLLSVLSQNIWAKGLAREGVEFNRPYTAFYGPKVAVCNHETSSDGETFSEGFKRLELGKLFGTRTWGGWVGIFGGRRLVDNGRNTVPQSTGWGIDDGEWLIEGPGVTPDVTVVDKPEMMLKNEDPQLDAAVEHLLEELKTWKKPAPRPEYPQKKLEINHLR